MQATQVSAPSDRTMPSRVLIKARHTESANHILAPSGTLKMVDLKMSYRITMPIILVETTAMLECAPLLSGKGYLQLGFPDSVSLFSVYKDGDVPGQS
jgi:hypothetical protein